MTIPNLSLVTSATSKTNSSAPTNTHTSNGDFTKKEIELGEALRTADLHTIARLLSEGVNIKQVDRNGNILFFELTKYDYSNDNPTSDEFIEMLQLLVVMNVDIHQTDKYGYNLLHHQINNCLESRADEFNEINIIRFLIDKQGFNPYEPDDRGITPFHLACACQNENIYAELIEDFVECENDEFLDGVIEVMCSDLIREPSSEDSLEPQKILARINDLYPDKNEIRPALDLIDCLKSLFKGYKASDDSDSEIYKEIIILLIKQNFRTPLLNKCANSVVYSLDLEFFKVLFEIDKTIIQYSSMNTPSYLFLLFPHLQGKQKDKALEFFNYLIESGIDPHAVDANGNTIYHQLASIDCYEGLEALDQLGEKIDFQKMNLAGMSLLSIAAKSAGTKVVQFALEKCPDRLFDIDNRKFTPLHYAIEDKNYEAVPLLSKNLFLYKGKSPSMVESPQSFARKRYDATSYRLMVNSRENWELDFLPETILENFEHDLSFAIYCFDNSKLEDAWKVWQAVRKRIPANEQEIRNYEFGLNIASSYHNKLGGYQLAECIEKLSKNPPKTLRELVKAIYSECEDKLNTLKLKPIYQNRRLHERITETFDNLKSVHTLDYKKKKNQYTLYYFEHKILNINLTEEGWKQNSENSSIYNFAKSIYLELLEPDSDVDMLLPELIYILSHTNSWGEYKGYVVESVLAFFCLHKKLDLGPLKDDYESLVVEAKFTPFSDFRAKFKDYFVLFQNESTNSTKRSREKGKEAEEEPNEDSSTVKRARHG